MPLSFVNAINNNTRNISGVQRTIVDQLPETPMGKASLHVVQNYWLGMVFKNPTFHPGKCILVI